MIRLTLALSAISGTPILAETSLSDEILSQVNLDEIIVARDVMPPVARFRFTAPGLQSGFDYAQLSDVMMTLCSTHALPKLGEIRAEMWQIIVSLSDRVVEFGASDANAVQVFETFDVVDNQCTWGGI